MPSVDLAAKSNRKAAVRSRAEDRTSASATGRGTPARASRADDLRAERQTRILEREGRLQTADNRVVSMRPGPMGRSIVDVADVRGGRGLSSSAPLDRAGVKRYLAGLNARVVSARRF